MGNLADKREEALRSALGRLRIALIVCDERHELRPLNERAAALFRDEALTGDLLSTRPSHPLSSLVQRVLAGTDEPASTVVPFPSGRKYAIEASRRSEKGAGHWILLLIEPAIVAYPSEDDVLGRWHLTEREEQVARLLLRGLPNEAIAAEMGISRETVKTHVRKILEKSACRSRSELLAKALRGE